MNIPKDLYEYLAGFADDKTIVKMLSVNKKFNDPVFFQRIFNRKYPLLIRYKKDNENWKDFYLSMVKYISKIEEEFGIPYIPIENYNPKKTYNDHKKGINIYNNAMFFAAKGHMEILKLLIEKGADNFNDAMVSAVNEENININIIKILIEKGATNLYYALRSAIEEGNIELVKLLIEEGATDLDYPLIIAGEKGNIEIVKLLIEKGADAIGWDLDSDEGITEFLEYIKK